MSSNTDVTDPAGRLTGIVFRKSQGVYTVRTESGSVNCALSSRLRKVLVYPTAAPTSLHHRVREVKEIQQLDPVAIGDVVAYTDAGDGAGLITEVLPRRSQLTRRAAFDHGRAGRTSAQGEREQVIAANIDQLVAVFPATGPASRWELLDRYIAAAELAGLPTLICLTKADLLTDPRDREALLAEAAHYEALGYATFLLSATTGLGLPALMARLQNRASVLAGKSGVGKTTLLNALQPGLGLRVKAISERTGKGVHTTTHLEMFELDFGGQVVDTPGMREFGLWQIEGPEVAHGFVELRPLIGACRFGLDCTHTHEPGCAIKGALERGALSARRYASYCRMLEDGR